MPKHLFAAVFDTECEARLALDTQVLERRHLLDNILAPSAVFLPSDGVVKLAKQAREHCIRLEHTILRSGHYLLALLQSEEPDLIQCFDILRVDIFGTSLHTEKMLGRPRIPFHTALVRFQSDPAIKKILNRGELRSSEYKSFLRSGNFHAAMKVRTEIDLLLESRDELLLDLWDSADRERA